MKNKWETVEMRRKKTIGIRTPRKGVMVGKKGVINGAPVAVIKQGRTIDTLSADEFVKALYGDDAQCVIMQKKT